jgi:hypothetical protein
METQKDKPEAVFKDGTIEVSVWKSNINEADLYSLKLKKSYLDNNGIWKDQHISIFQKDIGKSVFLLGEGYRFIMKQQKLGDIEKDKGDDYIWL